MYKQDIKGSIAHATMLGKQGIIPKEDSEKIVAELNNILKDIEKGKIEDYVVKSIEYYTKYLNRQKERESR